jgi:hypothetical protein
MRHARGIKVELLVSCIVYSDDPSTLKHERLRSVDFSIIISVI